MLGASRCFVMKIMRVSSLFCAVILVVLVFQAHSVSASFSTAGDFNHALASCGSQATASGSTGSNGPGNAIDGVSSTYWQSSSTTGWLAVQFQTLENSREVVFAMAALLVSRLGGDNSF